MKTTSILIKLAKDLISIAFLASILYASATKLIPGIIAEMITLQKSHGWPKINAEITSKNIHQLYSNKNGSEGVIRYRYTINNKEYFGELSTSDKRTSVEELKKEWVNYQSGGDFPITYDPFNPKRSISIKEQGNWPTLLLVFFIFTTALIAAPCAIYRIIKNTIASPQRKKRTSRRKQ